MAGSDDDEASQTPAEARPRLAVFNADVPPPDMTAWDVERLFRKCELIIRTGELRVHGRIWQPYQPEKKR